MLPFDIFFIVRTIFKIIRQTTALCHDLKLIVKSENFFISKFSQPLSEIAVKMPGYCTEELAEFKKKI